MAYSPSTAWRREKIPDFKCSIKLGEPEVNGDSSTDIPKKFFCPGDIVCGNLVVNAPFEFLAYGFAVALEGKISIHFDDNLSSKILVEESKYVFGQFRLLKNGLNGICEKRSNIEKGRSSYPFQFTLPYNIPCSFACPFGTIKYKLIGYYAGLYKPIPRTEKTIEVKVPINIDNLIDLKLSPVKTDAQPQPPPPPENIKPFQFNGEKGKFKICLKIDIDKKVLGPKEAVPFQIEIWNAPYKKTKTSFSLIQKMDFKAGEESRRMKRRIASVSTEKTGISWGWNDVIHFYFLKLNYNFLTRTHKVLKLPENLPTTNFGCEDLDVMFVDYYLKLEIPGIKEPEKFFKEEIPIKVGWLASKSRRNSQRPLAEGSEQSSRKNSLSNILPILNITDTTLTPSSLEQDQEVGEKTPLLNSENSNNFSKGGMGREGFVRIGGENSIPAYSDLTLEATGGISNLNLSNMLSPHGYQEPAELRRLSF